MEMDNNPLSKTTIIMATSKPKVLLNKGKL
jgi:hypothetical protein